MVRAWRASCLASPIPAAGIFFPFPYYITNQQFSGFVQDDWKVNAPPDLSTPGVRYDVFTPDVEKDNKIANFNENTLVFDYAGVSTA